jgi:hypothetical protein
MSKTLLRHTLINKYFWHFCWLPYLYSFSLYKNASFIIVSAETEYISTRSFNSPGPVACFSDEDDVSGNQNNCYWSLHNESVARCKHHMQEKLRHWALLHKLEVKTNPTMCVLSLLYKMCLIILQCSKAIEQYRWRCGQHAHPWCVRSWVPTNIRSNQSLLVFAAYPY